MNLDTLIENVNNWLISIAPCDCSFDWLFPSEGPPDWLFPSNEPPHWLFGK